MDMAKDVSVSLFPATHLPRFQDNRQKGVYKHTFSCVTRTHLGEISKHTLVCSQNTPLVLFWACPKFDTLSGVFCRMMCFVTLPDE